MVDRPQIVYDSVLLKDMNEMGSQMFLLKKEVDRASLALCIFVVLATLTFALAFAEITRLCRLNEITDMRMDRIERQCGSGKYFEFSSYKIPDR